MNDTKKNNFFKLIIFLIIFGVLIIIAITIISLFYYKNYIRSSLKNNCFNYLENDATLLYDAVNNNLELNFKEMSVLSYLMSIENENGKVKISDEDFKLLEQIKKDYNYEKIAILSVDGDGYLSNKEEVSYKSNEKFNYAKNCIDYLSINNNNDIICFKRITLKEVQYYIMAIVHVDNLMTIMPNNIYSGSGFSFIVDINGNIIGFDSEQSSIIDEINFLSYLGKCKNIEYPNGNDDFILGRSANQSVCLDYKDKTYFYKSISIKNTDLFYMIGIEEDKINDINTITSRRNLYSMISVFFISILFICSISYFIIKNIKYKNANEVYKRDELFRTMSEHIEQTFCFYNLKKNKYEFASDNFKKVFGIDPFEFKTSNFNILEKIVGNNVYSEIINYIQKKDITIFKNDFQYCNNNRIINGNVTIYPICEDGQIISYIGIFVDNTKEIEFKKMLLNSLTEFKKVNEQKSRFLSEMSHEIRTPINAIIGMIAISKNEIDKLDNQNLKRSIDQAHIACRNLLIQLNDLLDLSKIESGKMCINLENISLYNTIHPIIEIYSNLCKSKNIDFGYDFTHVSENIIKLDEKIIIQLVNNLLSNSLKFTNEFGFIHISVGQKIIDNDNLMLYITVKDNGIGMSNEFMKKIFTPFTQEINNKSYKGTGIGLTICKHLVDALGGTINVESQLGKGSKFCICIPCVYIHNDINQGYDEYDYSILSNKNVLVIEDIDINIEVISMFLEEKNMNVYSALNGKLGIEEYLKHEDGFFDIILMDIRMPVMDGLEAAKRIRSCLRKDAKIIPILAMTADAFVEDMSKSYDAGMNAHITKPIDEKIIYKTLYEQIIKYMKMKK